jgi:hypothetical protein
VALVEVVPPVATVVIQVLLAQEATVLRVVVVAVVVDPIPQ